MPRHWRDGRNAERRALKLARHRRRDARAALGLSTCHIRPRYWGEVSPDGQYLAVKSMGVRQCIPPTSKRSTVTTFSRKSRSRMLKITAQIDRAQLSRSLFLTLTYPSLFPSQPSVYTGHFAAFLKRLKRTFPKSSALWKLEFQKRGAPHYHLLVFGVPFIARDWLSRSWFQIARTGDERHLRAGTQVQRVKSTRQAISYVAKYVAKVAEDVPDSHHGRFWGIAHRREFPAHCTQWPMDRRGHARLARVIRNVVSSRSRQTAAHTYPPGWCFAHGSAGVRAIQWAAGLPISAVQ